MNLQERITYYYQEKKYNCSEAIIHAANDVYALNLDKDSMKMLAVLEVVCTQVKHVVL